VQAEEVRHELEVCFERAVTWLGDQALLALPKPVRFASAQLLTPAPLLKGKTIAIARDQAFSFIYDANLALLEGMGAKTVFFSPLHDEPVPDADALWLPGGYPELHAEVLAKSQVTRQSILEMHQGHAPILAECGGFLYCLEYLTDLEEHTYPMLGLMKGQGMMRGKRGCQGMQTAPLPEGDVRGHAHHRSRSSETPPPIGHGRRQRHSAPGEAIYRERSLTASYLHLFFPSNPEAIARLFGAESCINAEAV